MHSRYLLFLLVQLAAIRLEDSDYGNHILQDQAALSDISKKLSILQYNLGQKDSADSPQGKKITRMEDDVNRLVNQFENFGKQSYRSYQENLDIIRENHREISDQNTDLSSEKHALQTQLVQTKRELSKLQSTLKTDESKFSQLLTDLKNQHTYGEECYQQIAQQRRVIADEQDAVKQVFFISFVLTHLSSHLFPLIFPLFSSLSSFSTLFSFLSHLFSLFFFNSLSLSSLSLLFSSLFSLPSLLFSLFFSNSLLSYSTASFNLSSSKQPMLNKNWTQNSTISSVTLPSATMKPVS